MKDYMFHDESTSYYLKNEALLNAYNLIATTENEDVLNDTFFTLVNKACDDTHQRDEILTLPLFPLNQDRPYHSEKVTLLCLLVYKKLFNSIQHFKSFFDFGDKQYQKILSWDYDRAFTIAVINGNVDIANLIYEHRASAHQQTMLQLRPRAGHRSLFAITAMNGHFEMLTFLISKCDHNNLQLLLKGDGYLAFSCAAAYGNATFIDYLWGLCDVANRYAMLSSGSHRVIKWALDCCNSNSHRPSPKRIKGPGWVDMSKRFPNYTIAEKILSLYPENKLTELNSLRIHKELTTIKINVLILSITTFLKCYYRKQQSKHLPYIPVELWMFIFYNFAEYFMNNDILLYTRMKSSIVSGQSIFTIRSQDQLIQKMKINHTSASI